MIDSVDTVIYTLSASIFILSEIGHSEGTYSVEIGSRGHVSDFW